MRFYLATMALLVATWAAPAAAGTTPPDAFSALTGHYEAIRAALLHDTVDGVSTHAAAIEKTSLDLTGTRDTTKVRLSSDQMSECHEVLKEIAAHAAVLRKAKDLDAARSAFGELSHSMVRYRDMVPDRRPMVVYCPMAKQVWLQPQGEIGNPYFGAKMARCGEVVSKD